MLGNGHLEAYCFDEVRRVCHIRGKLRKKVWIGTGDIVLVGLRDYEKDKADVLLKYNADEARNLKSYGELPENGAAAHAPAPPTPRSKDQRDDDVWTGRGRRGHHFRRRVRGGDRRGLCACTAARPLTVLQL